MTPAALEADPAAIHACADSLREAAGHLERIVELVTGSLPDDWAGHAATAYAALARTRAGEAERAALQLRELARRVDDHGVAIASLLHRRGLLLASRPADRTEQVRRWEQDLAREEHAMRQAFGAGAGAGAGVGLATPGPTADPSAVAAWWSALGTSERRQALAARPVRLGALDGLPAAARHGANVAVLEEDLRRLEDLAAARGLTTDEQHRWQVARATRTALDTISATSDPVTGEPVPAFLHLYDPGAFDGDGRVAVAAGDPDTADDVALLVPGAGNDATSVLSQAGRALTLHQAARHLDPDASHATVAWIGYDAPDNRPLDGDGDLVGVVTERLAREGAPPLAGVVDGLRAVADPHLTVVGHSYGSTTAALAASGPGLDVDDLVLVGSPGAGDATPSAATTGLDPGHVWVLRSSRDPVAALGDRGWVHGGIVGLGLGPDPSEDDWGATRLQAESSPGVPADPWGDHDAYFDHDTESLHNLARVVSADYGDVRRAPSVHDPWYGISRDPEVGREPTAPSTRPVR